MAITAAPGPSVLSSLLVPPDRDVLIRHHPNALIVGDMSTTETLLLALAPSFADPITFWEPGATLTLPAGGGTLVLRNVGNLATSEQRALITWLDEGHCAQVVSTSPRSLMPLVEQDAFLAMLYYRLNTVLIELPDA